MNFKILSRRRVALWFALAIFAASFLYLLLTFQWSQVFDLFLTADFLLWPLLLMFLTIPLYWLLRTLRWFMMLRESGFSCSFTELYLVTAIALSVAQFTPFQSGEMMKMELMKRRCNLDRGRGYSSFVVERCADLLVVLLVAMLALLVWSNLSLNRQTLFLLIFFLFFTGFLFCLAIKIIPLPQPVSRFLTEIFSFVRQPALFLSVLLLTCLSWLVVAAGWHFAFAALQLSPGYPSVVLLVALVTLINLSSLIPGSIGIAEAAIALVLIFLHQEPAAAQAGALMIRGYGCLILIVGGVHYLLYRYFRSPSKIPVVSRTR